MINFKETFDEYKELLKKYTIAQLIVFIRKDQDGEYFFDTVDLKDDLYILGGFFPEELVLESLKDFDFKCIDKEGLWDIQFLLSYCKGSYDESSYAEIEYTECQLSCTIEEYEAQQKENALNKDLFGNTNF